MCYRVISRLVGLLLLVAAGLKLSGFNVDPVVRSGQLNASWVQLVLIQFEILLGIWLLSGWKQAGSWLATVITFTGFAAYSLYAALIGQTSCGCFGKLPVSPWYAFALDLGVLLILGLCRPLRQDLWPSSAAEWRSIAGDTCLVAIEVAALFGILTLAAYVFVGSPAAALARLRGEEVSVYPDFVDLGTGESGEIKVAQVEIVNRTNRPIRVVGGTSDCSCTVLGDLPVELGPGDVRSISVQMRMPKSSGLFARSAVLQIDNNGMTRVKFQVGGRVY